MKKEIVKIVYEKWALNGADKGFWTAILPNQEALDYGDVNHLINVCEKEGYDWQVIRPKREV